MTISVFARTLKRDESTGLFVVQDFLLGCSSISIDEEPSCLLCYLGVLDSFPDDFKRQKEIRNLRFQRSANTLKTGTLLVLLAQLVQSIKCGAWVPVICQVYKKPNKGPFFFYKKLCFLQLDDSHEQVHQQFIHRKEHLILGNPELIWMVLFPPLGYLLLPTIDDSIEDDSFKAIVKTGYTFLLKNSQYSFQQNLVPKRLQQLLQGSNDTFDVSKTYERKIQDMVVTKEGKSVLWFDQEANTQHIVSQEANEAVKPPSQPKRIEGSVNVLKKLFQEMDDKNKLYVIDYSHNLVGKFGTSSLFVCMSRIFYGYEVFHQLLKMFFYFYYRNLSRLGLKHRFFVEVMPEMADLIVERTYRQTSDQKYGASRLIKSLGLPEDEAELRSKNGKVQPKFYKVLLKLFSDSFLKSKFCGHKQDLELVAPFFNTNVNILKIYTEDNSPIDQHYQREWRINIENTGSGDPFIRLLFSMEKDPKEMKQAWLAQLSKSLFVVISQSKIVFNSTMKIPSNIGQRHTDFRPQNLLTDLSSEIIDAHSPTKTSSDILDLRDFVVQPSSTTVAEQFQKYLKVGGSGEQSKNCLISKEV